MTSIQRQRVVWTGFPGGPGLSTFYFTDAAASQSALRTFLSDMTLYLPPDVFMHVEPGGDVIDDATGVLTSVWAGTLLADLVGTGDASGYSCVSGFITRWETIAILAGRRLHGRTYFVPAPPGG